MRRHALIAAALLAGCWTEQTPTIRHPEPVSVETSSYRATTIAVDAIGLAAMSVGLIGLSRGYDDDISGSIMGGGLLLAGYATPIIHLAHGKTSRAGGSWLVRSLSATTGMTVGLLAANPREGDVFGAFTGMLWGIAGGLAVGSAIDAVYFHDRESTHEWTPTITTSDDGARVGVAGTF